MIASPHRAHRAIAAAALVAVICIAPHAFSAEKKLDASSAPPTSRVLGAEFETRGPWKIPADQSVASKTARAASGMSWDLRKISALMVKAERGKSGTASARMRWLVQSRVGGWYLSPAAPLPINGSAVVTVNCLEDAGELTPIEHQRPWDSLAAADVVALQLRIEISQSATKNEPLELTLSLAHVETSNKSPDKPRLLDITLSPPPPGSHARGVLTFRISPLPADPYAASGDGDVRVRLPGGAQALAFLDQNVIARDDGSAQRIVSAGLPYWKAYLPEWPGRGSVEIVSGKSAWKINASALDSDNYGSPQKPQTSGPVTPELSGHTQLPPFVAPSKALAHPRWETPLETNAVQEVVWTGAPTRWHLTGDKWERDVTPASAEKIWRPVPFWNSSWGEYSGARRPDPTLAAQMDALLAKAAATGETRPLTIFDGGALERQGVFNWAAHPLQSRLAGPGEMFRTPEGLDFCARWVRFCLARYAHSKAVSALWMTSDLNAPGASDFHKTLARLLNDWRGRCEFGGQLITFHPLAQPPQVVKDIGSFEQARSSTANWTVDQRLGAAMGRMINQEGLDGSRCFEVRALDTSTISVAATAHFMFEAADYRRPADDNFFDCGALMFDVWTPPDAPHDMRVGVHLRDRDGEWFQALLPGMVRPGDWTTFALDLSERNSHKLTPVNPKRVWTPYSRQRITEIGLHIYSTHPNWRVRGLAQTLNTRFDNIRGVNFEAKLPYAVQISLFNPLNQNDAGDHTINIEVVARTPGTNLTPPPPPPSNRTVERGGMIEFHVRVNKAFANPFDPCDCDLMGIVTTPSGKTHRIPMFFNQLCERREQTPGGMEIVEASGVEFFTLRFRAQETGQHSLRFELREGGKYAKKRRWEPDDRFTPQGDGQLGVSRAWPYTTYAQQYPDGQRPIDTVTFAPGTLTASLDLGAAAFTVTESQKPFHGFLRTAADRRHFEFEDGTFFYPIGPCLRSPSDTRVPYNSPKFDRAMIDALGKRGTYQYDDYLSAFEKGGVNWARVWMCSWWGALEWRRDWPGYQGLGRYNLLNAWCIDYILAECEKRGIYINLALTNHGQFTLNIDTEWKNNPYNARLGGPINAPMEIFTRGEAKIAHENKLRYVAARYGHSPNVMAFSLFSELEFTEEYDRSLPYTRGQRNGPDTPAVHMEQWHAEMASFLKSIDPNHHLVATHFSHPTRGESTMLIPEIDIATSNAYSAFPEWGEGKMDASIALHDFWDGTDDKQVRGFKHFNKPALVEEQGRHWMGMDGGGQEHNTKAQLDADLHAGLWGSMVTPLSGATGYWWWLHVHFDNRYGDYRALSKYMEGEDFRPQPGEMQLEPVTWKVKNDELYGRAMKSDRRVFAWVYSPLTPFGDTEPDVVSNAILKGGGLKPGKYRVEFWDTYKGEKMTSQDVEVKAGEKQSFSVKMPAVKRDLAVKIKPVN